MWDLLVLVLVTTFISLSFADGCAPGFEPFYNGKCYQVLEDPTYQELPYDHWKSRCANLGALPAIIRNEQENNALVFASQMFTYKHHTAPFIFGPYYQWIGLKCDTTIGKFVWEDGSIAHYTNFYEPYNCSGTTGNSFFLLQQDTGKWSQHEHGKSSQVICEHPRMSNFPCPFGMDLVHGSAGDTCISVGSEELTRSDAEKKCSNASAHLASIHDKNVNNYIYRSAMDQGIKAIHIGAYTEEEDAYGTLAWRDGTSENYDNFYPGFPDPDAFGDCVAMQTKTPYNGRWISVECDTKLPYACVRPALNVSSPFPSKCPQQEYRAGETIYSPGFPMDKAVNECGYVIRAQHGKRIEITVVVFESNMCCDSLTLFDGLQAEKRMKEMRGLFAAGTKFTSNTNYVRMVWNATNAVKVRGFHLETREV